VTLCILQYKQIKKVKEHHKKKRKELKKSGRKPKEPKTVGSAIPSQWPFKEELLKEMAWKQQQVLMAEKQKREQRKRNRDVSTQACAVAGLG
jgi:nuclear GTP-binding protein